MTRPASLEDALQKALTATSERDYDAVLRLLVFAFTRAAHERTAAMPDFRRIPMIGPLQEISCEELEPTETRAWVTSGMGESRHGSSAERSGFFDRPDTRTSLRRRVDRGSRQLPPEH